MKYTLEALNSTNEFSSTTETYAIHNILRQQKEIKRLQAELKEYIRITNAITKALNNLNPKYKDVILLRYFEKMTWDQIDAIIPDSTARRWNGKALEQLAIELKNVRMVR